MTENEKMAELLLPNIQKTPDYYEKLYPERDLPQSARVVRIAPSPTGYLHIGTLFTALINRITATTTDGVFYTRIEDTDKKREIEGGIEDIIGGLKKFGIEIDEGFVSGTEEKGEYGPYQQSHRAEIYQTYVKDLIKKGFAYPCFCTAEDLNELRQKQEAQKIRTGYHGEWAVHRNITYAEAKENIENGKPFVIRLKSPGNEENRIYFEDGIKGKIEMPENDEDFVILKSDGIPTYHFAHAVDDHLMRSTHIMRGEEWISSTPKHIQLFKLLGFRVPKYVHISPILKLDNGNKRKISKRKDPEAAVKFFVEQGFHPESVIEYLMTIAASDYEDWRRANPTESYKKFKFNIKKMSVSGALFDWDKLCDVAKNYVSKLDCDAVLENLLEWAKEYDKDFYDLLNRDLDYAKGIFSIDRGGKKPRKDIVKWSDAKEYSAYFFDELFVPSFEVPENIDKKSAAEFLQEYIKVYDENDEQQEWFEKIKQVCPTVGFAGDTKEYKQNPENFKGSPGDASTVIRIAVTGRKNTPDLCRIMKLLGKDKSIVRIKNYINEILKQG